ncbi:MAG: peptidylprolyl isomerase [Planctomycetota bacterium]
MLRPLLIFALTCGLVLAGGVPARLCCAQPWANDGVAPQPLDECEVIARVNGSVVLACEVMWQVNLMLEDNADKIPPGKEAEVRRMLMTRHLMQMLDMKILYSDFRRKAPQADLPSIHKNLAKPFNEQEVPALMKRVGVEDRSALEARLVELGTSIREQREDFNQRMIARTWVNEGLNVDTEVRHDELLAYYRENAADYDFPTQAKWEELMVRFSQFGGDKQKAYAALVDIGNAAYRAAVAQPDKSRPAFEAIAKAKSQGFNADEGGRYGWTTKGSLTAARVDEALFTLPVGEMSPILESDRGWHIVRVLERREAGRKPFTEVQAEITKKIRDRRFDDAIAQRLDELRRDAKIWTLYTGEIDPDEYATARAGGRTKRR